MPRSKPKHLSRLPLPASRDQIRCPLRAAAYEIAVALKACGPIKTSEIALIASAPSVAAQKGVDFLTRMGLARVQRGLVSLNDPLDDSWLFSAQVAFTSVRDLVKLSFRKALRNNILADPLQLVWICATTHSELEAALCELWEGSENEEVRTWLDARASHPIYSEIFDGVNDDAEVTLGRARLRLLSALVSDSVSIEEAEMALTTYYREAEAVLFVQRSAATFCAH
ncbi:MAG: hypothetical protein K2Y29_11575 [Beijerinckiaceae bacterium]|nr:hypothetical protein [Beijerinckiaceae bacterium]